VIAPVTTASGRIVSPLRWHKENPFKRITRIRNWLMWCLALDEGLRLGEILGLYVSDFLNVEGTPSVRVVGRADNPFDVRLSKPQAKTLNRILPTSLRVQAALRAYITSRPPIGRRPGGTPFLITTARGNPLSESSAGNIVEILRRAGLASRQCTFHGLRHAWAEDLADALFAKNRKEREIVISKLRTLGGWALDSKMPAHYADGAIARDARRDMRERQSRLFNFVEAVG
jgi:integrase